MSKLKEFFKIIGIMLPSITIWSLFLFFGLERSMLTSLFGSFLISMLGVDSFYRWHFKGVLIFYGIFMIVILLIFGGAFSNDIQ